MKKLNLWKTLFCSVLVLAAFTACSDDDDKGGGSVIPAITVNGGATATVGHDLTTGDTPAVTVESNAAWEVTFDVATDASWCTPSVMGGKSGTTSLTFNLGAATTARTATVTLKATSKYEGIPITKTAKITINQTNDGPISSALYEENCGTKVEKVDGYWPYVDKFTGWTRGGTLDQKAVTYSGSYASVANSGKAFDPTEDEKAEVSGPPYASMNKSTSVFYINDINIASSTNFTFSFTAAQQVDFSGGVVLGDMTDETIRFSVTTDGEKYAPVAMKIKKVGTGYWYLCTAEFKLPAGLSVDKITVRFDNYAGLANHGLRLDDFKLYEGGNGEELKFETAPPATVVTVGDAIKGGAGKAVEISATVVATHTQGILIGDASGVMLAFIGAAPEVAVNDVVTVKGTTEQRNGVIQLGKTGLTITKTGTGSYTTPAAEVMDGEAVTAYIATATANTAAYKYVKYIGEFVVSGNYYNVTIAGTTVKGSVAYGKEEWASFNNKQVAVEGWLLGGTANYLQTMATKVTADTTTPVVDITAPTAFAAASPVAQTVAYTVTNTTADQVTFALEGTNADKFALGAKTENSIVVSAKGDNTTTAAYTAKLVAKIAGETVASVDLKQSIKASGEKVELTLDDIKAAGITAYTDVNITATDGSVWKGFLSGSATRLQFGWNTTTTKDASKSHLLSPVLPQAAKTVTITPEKDTTDGRVFVLLPVDFKYTGQSVDEVKALAYAVSDPTVKGSTTPITFEAGSAGKQFMIRAVGGAIYVTNVTITY